MECLEIMKIQFFKSFIPNTIKRSPMRTTNQNNPPLRNTHAEWRKLKSFPNHVQLYADEAQAIKIAPTKIINPIKSSTHLFMVF